MDDNTKDSRPPENTHSDPLILYARSLHNYTLRQWAETRRIAEEKARERQEKAGGQRQRAASLPDTGQGAKAEGQTKKSSSSQPDQSSDNQT